MLRENNPASETGEFLANQFLPPNPLPNPQRNGPQKRLQPARGVGKITVQDAVKLEERLFVERDVVQVADFDSAFAQAVFDGLRREIRVVFLARETLLLRRRDDSAVPHQTRRAVVVERRDTKDVHPKLAPRIAVLSFARIGVSDHEFASPCRQDNSQLRSPK